MRKLFKISMFLISIFILTSSTTSMVGAEDPKGTLEVDNRLGKTDAVTQTIKITQDMKGWIATHFDPNVIGEYLSVSELEDQKGRYFLELLSGDGKVLRRMIKSAADVKHILGEINDGSPLINYIDKHRGEINKPRAYNDNRNSNIETDQKLSKSEGTSKTQRETVANDTTENNKDKTPGKALTQTNKPETKITDTKPKLAKKVKAGNADAKHKQDTRVNSEQEAKERAEQEARAKAEQEAQERAVREARAKAELEAKERVEQEARAKAEQGIAEAQYNLGIKYENGIGVRKDDNEAVKWYRKAAEQGYAKAQYNLGVMYDNGKGVRENDNEAVKWYRKAAEQGYAKAQYNLGFMYANGKGVRKNNNEAEKWYHMAAGQIYGKAYGGSGYLFKLHSSYRDLSVSQVQSIPNISIRKKDEWGFYGHSTIIHSYNSKSINGDKVVIDNATGLMWHQNGSYNYFLEYKMAEKWLKKLNKRGYAGYSDWKFPTVEEASSLLESYKKNGGLYIDPVFSNKQGSIYTGDKENGSAAAWRVRFSYGSVYLYNFNHYDYVRPVRSGK